MFKKLNSDEEEPEGGTALPYLGSPSWLRHNVIFTTGLHWGFLPSRACYSTRTRPPTRLAEAILAKPLPV